MNLSLRNMKIIAHDIISEELESYGLSTNIMPYTFVEYSGSRTLKKSTVIEKMSNWFIYKIAGGFYHPKSNNIVIFIDKIKKLDNSLYSLIEVCFHEARHFEQKQFNNLSYSGFLRDIDHFLEKNNYFTYLLNHDEFSFEVGAHLYSVKKAKEYMMKNYPEEYEKEKYNIYLREWKFSIDYSTYDFSKTLDMVIKCLKNKENSINIDDISPILSIFINENGTFKSINDIIQNELFSKLDKRIIYGFFSCESFLKQFNINDENSNNLSIIYESLKYTIDLYCKQLKWLDDIEYQKDAKFHYDLNNTKNKFKYPVKIYNYIFYKILRMLLSKKTQKISQIKLLNSYINQFNELSSDNYSLK